MQTQKFKTTIRCSGCIAASTPYLNQAVGEGNWKVDTTTSQKLLTVTSENGVPAATIIGAVRNAGYTAEEIQ